jgi:two-component system, chemotaxis family, CheB/CheR fusion protein
VIDDNRDAAESLTTLLDLFGHSTRSAHDGETALEAAKQFQPHVIFIDIDLPGMHGFEVCRRLRALPETRDAVCIALTGFGSDEDRERSRKAGFDHHLVKPADVSQVQELLARIQR